MDFKRRFRIPEAFELEAEFEVFFKKTLEERKNLLSAADNNILELLDTEITRGKFKS